MLDVAKARTRDSLRAFKKLTRKVDGEVRFVKDPPLLVPLEDLVLSEEARHRTERSLRKLIKRVPAHAGRRAPSAGGVPLRAHGPQGGRRRQRRHPGLGLPHDGRRRAGPADPPGQGGPALGAGALRRPERLRPPRSAGGGRPAPHADGQRHLPRVAAGQGHRRPHPRLLHPPAPRLEGLGPRGHPAGGGRHHLRPDVRGHPGPGPRPVGRLDRHRRLPREGRPSSTRPWPTSPPPTPTRTSGTTRPW